ncbi:WD40 repeat domain-containing protein [Streptomyces sp. NPDC059957]|uniref:WD40 repeat domain-containing protein n=1 Tax=unclassified Streptomyces TaxID=2593676 RepID=UPI003652E265
MGTVQNGFDEELSRLASDLRELRIGRGNPPYRKLEARASKSGAGIRLPVATQSDAFRGKRLLSLDTLMALVRILYSYDEFGQETAVPPHNSPRLEPWRSRWRALASLQPAAPDRAKAVPWVDPDRAKAVPAVDPGHAKAVPGAAPWPAGPPAPPYTPTGGAGFSVAHRLTVHEYPNHGAVFSPDGRMLATVGGGDVHLWDPVRGRLVGEISPEEHVVAVAFSPDGRTLAMGDDQGAARLWDLSDLAPVGPALLGHEAAVGVLAFSPDGRVLVTAADDESVRPWNTATGEPDGNPYIGHFGEVRALVFLPGGDLLAGIKGRHVLRLWDPVAGAGVGEPMPGHENEVMAFSPDGRLLATVGLDGTRLWDAVTGGALGGPLVVPDGSTCGAAFSPDGRLLATACDDGTVRLWDTATGSRVGEPLAGSDMALHDVAFSSDGRMLAACGERDTVVVYHRNPVTTGSVPSLGARSAAAMLRQGHALALPAVSSGTGKPLGRLVFSPDGSRLLVQTADRRILTWDPETRARLPEVLKLPLGGPWGLEFPDDGGPAALWSREAPRTAPLVAPVSLLPHVAFSADGRLVATVGAGGLSLLPTAIDPADVADEGPDPVSDAFALALSPDGRTLVTAHDTKVTRWDLAPPEPTGRDLETYGPKLGAMALSPSGRLLAVGDLVGTLQLWDHATQRPPNQRLVAHAARVYDLAFSPNGRLLASAGADGVVKVLDTRTRGFAVHPPLTGHSGAVRGVAFSPDGSLLATAGEDGTLRFWVLPETDTRRARPR